MRNALLSHVIIEDAASSRVLLPLDKNAPYLEEYGSVEDELVARLSHDHRSFKDDNTKVHYYLEEVARSTQHAASIKN